MGFKLFELASKNDVRDAQFAAVSLLYGRPRSLSYPGAWPAVAEDATLLREALTTAFGGDTGQPYGQMVNEYIEWYKKQEVRQQTREEDHTCPPQQDAIGT